jgi:pyridinium-3,5-biscarboxylic acid mononucleotide sulfurtransferase
MLYMEDAKFETLLNILKGMQKVLLAYSGGADSTLLLKSLMLAGVETLAVKAVSEIIPAYDRLTAEETAKQLGTDLRVFTIDALSNEDFTLNTADRCFICKANLFKILEDMALSEGYGFILDGSNSDDDADFRPGRDAASEYKVRSPLLEARLSKNEIREISRRLGLSTYNKPSSSCLATRIPYGKRITKEALTRIEKSEDLLRSLGFQEIRVRDHGELASIEVGKNQIHLLLETERREKILAGFKSFGYIFVSLDMEGYRSGSLNLFLQRDPGKWTTRNT